MAEVSRVLRVIDPPHLIAEHEMDSPMGQGRSGTGRVFQIVERHPNPTHRYRGTSSSEAHVPSFTHVRTYGTYSTLFATAQPAHTPSHLVFFVLFHHSTHSCGIGTQVPPSRGDYTPQPLMSMSAGRFFRPSNNLHFCTVQHQYYIDNLSTEPFS